MAVVRTEDVRLETGSRFKRVVKFSGTVKDKAKRFTCAYPPDVALALGETDAYAAGLEEVVAAWVDGCERALEAKKTVERVIVAEISTCGTIRRGGKKVFNSDNVSWRNDSAERQALKIEIEVGVFDEIAMALGKDTRYSYEPVDSTIPRAVYPVLRDKGEHRVDHVWPRSYGDTDDDAIPEKLRLPRSAENEAWFAGLVTATENVILKLNTLRRDRKALQESIDRGRGLLAAAPGGE